jgi:PAS domain S-box-containing protein
VSRDPHIIVVGGEDESRVAMLGALRNAGFDRVRSCAAVAMTAHFDAPDLLVLVGPDVPTLCTQARESPPLGDVPILAMVPAIPQTEGGAALAAGADDVIYPPLQVAVLGARVRLLIATRVMRRELRAVEDHAHRIMRVQSLLASGGDNPESLRDALVICAESMGFDRVSLVAHVDGSELAYVIAATDDPTLSKFTLHMADYPELQAAQDSGQPVVIADALSDPLTAPVADRLADKHVRAVMVLPVIAGRRTLGSVFMRRASVGVDHLDARRLAFGRMFVDQVAVQLAHGRVMESLKEQTGRISRARYEAERRLRTIDSLKEHFEAAADGVVVLDELGRILFVNHTAERITGFARDGLVGSPLLDLVPSLQAETLGEVIRSVLAEINLEAFDLELGTTGGEPIVVSVTTSTVLAKSGAVILSFRDVTAQRALETELRKTKEFLEKLIDSTVDAIVAADIRGTIILFNSGAERIYGYSAEEVLGQLHVSALYPEGVAHAVMRMLRAPSYGGGGRLEQTRREIRTKSGELVPVNMTASIIYEDGREVATVGIFSDLRERLRIEQRLQAAQEKLQLTEKQALVAELAGAAAHELNQPLTSILGYAQLIVRQSDTDAQHLRAVNVIIREGERMAEIVKKIGRITKLETKEYVGDTAILDLDKAASSNPDLVLPPPDPGDPPTDPQADDAPDPDDARATRRISVVSQPAPPDGDTARMRALEEDYTGDETTAVGRRPTAPPEGSRE